MDKEQLINFENRVKELWEAGELPFLIHLCGGNEDELIEIFSGIADDDYVFSTHRNHYHALLNGMPQEQLLEKIKHGDSMFVFDRQRNFFTSSIVSGICAIAAGVAYAVQRQGKDVLVVVFCGDGAEDFGHFYEAVRFVHTHKLPCIFYIEDNDRSVNSSISDRWGTSNEFAWPKCVRRYYYHPTYPHAGSGCKHKIEFKK